MEVSRIPKRIRKEIKEVGQELPTIHFISFLLYLFLFAAIVVTEAYERTLYEARLTNNRYYWTSDKSNTTVNYVNTTVSIAMVMWIGSAVMAVWHFLHWVLWNKSFGNMDSMKTTFARYFNISSRWWAFVVVEVFCYVILSFLMINVDSLTISMRVLIGVAISALFSSFDRINRPYLIESLSDEPVELKGFTDLKRKDEEQPNKTEGKNDDDDEDIKRVFKLDFCTFNIGMIISTVVWFFFVYYLYNAEGFSDAPIFLKCAVWFFPFFNCLTILSSLTAYLKPSAISHIRSSTLFYLLNFLTYASLTVTTLVGLYASY